MEKSVKEIVAEAERLDIKDKAVLALSELLFDKNMVSQIPKFRALFLRVSVFFLSFQFIVGIYARFQTFQGLCKLFHWHQ